MKTTIKSKIFTIALAAIFTAVIPSTSVLANDKIDNPVELKYVGSANRLPVYQLNLNNTDKGSFFVSIMDENGALLYNERVSGSKIVRNYQFDSTIPEGAKVTFEVTNLKDNSAKVYTLSKTVKMVEDFVVNEIK